MSQRVDQPQHVLAGLGIEAVIQHGVRRVERGRGLDRRAAYTPLGVVANAQFAADVQGVPGEGLVRAPASSMSPPRPRRRVCASSRGPRAGAVFGGKLVLIPAMQSEEHTSELLSRP